MSGNKFWQILREILLSLFLGLGVASIILLFFLQLTFWQLVGLLVIGIVLVAVYLLFKFSRFKEILNGSPGAVEQSEKIVNPKQIQTKEENLARLLLFARERGEISNDDAEKLLHVSDATAERYLDELEKQGKLEQVGRTGRNVIYKPK